MSQIHDFIVSQHPKGRYGFTDEGYSHYVNILTLIKNKIFNPDQPESSFITACYNEDWNRAKYYADTRNKEAIEYCDMFKKFNQHIKSTQEYHLFLRERNLELLLND